MNVPLDIVLDEVAQVLGRLQLELILERAKARAVPEPPEEPHAD